MNIIYFPIWSANKYNKKANLLATFISAIFWSTFQLSAVNIQSHFVALFQICRTSLAISSAPVTEPEDSDYLEESVEEPNPDPTELQHPCARCPELQKKLRKYQQYISRERRLKEQWKQKYQNVRMLLLWLESCFDMYKHSTYIFWDTCYQQSLMCFLYF